MHVELKSFRFTCDECSVIELVKDVPCLRKPEGWVDLLACSRETNEIIQCTLCAACNERRERKAKLEAICGTAEERAARMAALDGTR